VTAVADEIQIDDAPFRGSVVRPGTPDYDIHRRIWNGSIDKNPALIIRCAGVADVINAVKFGRESGLPVAIRSGGHSFPGLSVADDALMIDLQPMKGVRVDPEKMTARVQAGVLLGELDKETQAFGLAVPSGIVTHTGVAGLTLGGGIGWIQRKYGLSVDQLVSMDVVTAEGEFVKASADENADLFWGLRGGGGNFGIVTSFELAVHPVGPEVYAGPLFLPGDAAGDLLRFYRDWAPTAPDAITTAISLASAPPLPVIPEEWHGKKVAIVIAVCAGPVADGEALVREVRTVAEPVADLIHPMPYQFIQGLLDPLWPKGINAYFKATNLAGLSDETIDSLVAREQNTPGPQAEIRVHQTRGAVDAVCAQRGHRHARGGAAGCAHRVGAHRDRLDEGRPDGSRLRELPRRRRRWCRGGLWAGDVCPARRAEGALRPDERLPPEPEHRAAGVSPLPDPGAPRASPDPPHRRLMVQRRGSGEKTVVRPMYVRG